VCKQSELLELRKKQLDVALVSEPKEKNEGTQDCRVYFGTFPSSQTSKSIRVNQKQTGEKDSITCLDIGQISHIAIITLKTR
jgi:hypothetical protein